MIYEQLERCYKTVMSQRDRYHDMVVDAEQRIIELEDKLQFLIDDDLINDHSVEKEVKQLLSR